MDVNNRSEDDNNGKLFDIVLETSIPGCTNLRDQNCPVKIELIFSFIHPVYEPVRIFYYTPKS